MNKFDKEILESFNSLQTGRCIQSAAPLSYDERYAVSIPFKREGVSKAFEGIKINEVMLKFQFPSNGKVYPKAKSRKDGRRGGGVSIPFKREGVSKEDCRHPHQRRKEIVSIPFKREGVSKARIEEGGYMVMVVSIPFKREGVSKEKQGFRVRLGFRVVSIPFKREGVSKVHRSNYDNDIRGKVSIPFKREGVSKGSIAQVFRRI